jgi:acetyl esterase
MSLHPQVVVLLERVARSHLPPYYELPPAVARRVYHDTRTATAPVAPEMASVFLMLMPGPAGPLPVRVYRPAGSAKGEVLPALVYYHGGGWVIGDLDTHDVACRQLSNGARCVVFSVEYRLAPEARFPAAVDDCVAVTRHIAAQAAELGIDPARIAVGGDSAGGNLAAVVCIDARDSGKAMPCLQLLVYPATDQRAGQASHVRNADGYLLTRKVMDYFRDHYLPREADWLDWRASPLLATSLAGLPPAYVLTAGYDPLVDEGREYAERLAAEGVKTQYKDYPDMVHGFLLMGGVLDTANEAMAGCCAALRGAFEAKASR